MDKKLILIVLILIGNIRVTYGLDEQTQFTEVLEENNYYPFGLRHNNYNMSAKEYAKLSEGVFGIIPLVTPQTYKYKYNCKEWQDDLSINLYDYGARNYDAALGRWINIDPLAEKSSKWSPYNYAYNNPVRFIDPDGMTPNVGNNQTIAYHEFGWADGGRNLGPSSGEPSDGDNEDIIHVDAEGNVIDIEEAEGEHKVVDENGNELPVNDYQFDQDQLEAFIAFWNYTGGKGDAIKLFTVFTNKQMANKFNELEIGAIRRNLRIATVGSFLSFKASRYAYLAWVGHSAFDFADDMSGVARKGGNMNTEAGEWAPEVRGDLLSLRIVILFIIYMTLVIS